MTPATHLTTSLALVSCLTAVASAMQRQTLSTVIYTTYGERVPPAVASQPFLTTYGAQQLYNAGSRIRNLYVAASSAYNNFPTIRGLSTALINNAQLSILSTGDQWTSASAQAFLQGLYPPLAVNSRLAYNVDPSSQLSNGTFMLAPLSGYQYPSIHPLTTSDYHSIWVDGATNCPNYLGSIMHYSNTSDYTTTMSDSQTFYNSLNAGFLYPVFAQNSVNYDAAYSIWEYLSYAYNHNTTVSTTLTQTQLTTARNYASQWAIHTYGSTSLGAMASKPHLSAIAGRTLAYRVYQTLYNSINSGGSTNLVNLMFGNFEPMVSFAGLAHLISPQNAAFYNVPAPGSSYIFELFSLDSSNDTSNYPSTSDMYVRFLFINGTDRYSSVVEYPLFGASPSQTTMTLADFTSAMTGIMVNDMEDWCNTCGSAAIFCNGIKEPAGTTYGSSGRTGVSSIVAGVIGAFVTLALALLLIGMTMLLGRVRFHRVPSSKTSPLRGFKGAEKLQSDQDLTIPKGGAGVTVTDDRPDEHHGHERVGSWELRAKDKDIESLPQRLGTAAPVAGRASYEDDEINVNPFAAPVKPKDQF